VSVVGNASPVGCVGYGEAFTLSGEARTYEQREDWRGMKVRRSAEEHCLLSIGVIGADEVLARALFDRSSPGAQYVALVRAT
jgi:hypothetical protein